MDKPDGPTSHDVVARARRLFGTRAVGHAGTLDPFATGLLVLVFGGATRLAGWAERHRKGYRAALRLGVTTTTDDRTGQVVADRGITEWPTEATVRAGLAHLCGTQQQRPPAYSAKKVAGVRSYRAARRGDDPRPAAVTVTVFRLELLDYCPPLVTIQAEVSPGTYVRALGRDLGELWETGAHVAELRREWIGPWRIESAYRLQDLTGREALLPPRELVGDLPGVALSPEEVEQVGHGRDVRREGPTAGEAALLEGDRLVAVGRAVASGWHPAVVVR